MSLSVYPESMEIWGVGSFENDSAVTYMDELLEDGVVALQEALEVVLDPELEYLDAEEGARAVAAAEVVAAILTGSSEFLTEEEWVDWAEQVPTGQLRPLRALALEALEHVQAPHTGLRELWDETDDLEAWQQDLQRLVALLS